MTEDFPSRQTSCDGYAQNCGASDTETSPAGNHCSCHTLSTADHAHRNANNLCTAKDAKAVFNLGNFKVYWCLLYNGLLFHTTVYQFILWYNASISLSKHLSICPSVRQSVRTSTKNLLSIILLHRSTITGRWKYLNIPISGKHPSQ